MSEITLNRGQIFDLFALDRDVRKSTGMGFFPSPIAKIFEKYALLGAESLDVEEVRAIFENMQRVGMEDITPLGIGGNSSSP